jgi:hypothetical protein
LSLMEKIRKETRDTKNLRMAVPTKDLKKQASTITKAPKNFLEEVRKPQERTLHTSPTRPAVRAPAPPMAISRPNASSNDRSFLDQEARLRTLTSGRVLPRQDAALISSLDRPSSPPPQCNGTKMNPTREPVTPSRPVRHPSASRPGSSAQFLEPGPSIGSPTGEAARVSSPRIRSPQPSKMKRKAPPSVFMEAKRTKVAPSSSADDF